jgi:Domain of unknown function (DUF4331)
MKKPISHLRRGMTLVLIAAIALLPAMQSVALASSHMDAPMVTNDDPANTTDVYAFPSRDANGKKSLVLALGVYPHENPGVGPNKYNFDDNVRYEIHVALGKDLAAGRPTFTYRFEFKTRYKNQNTILQSFLGVINNVDDANQNLTQYYTITKYDHRRCNSTLVGKGIVPPNNQGILTPFYNQGNSGDNPARKGVATAAELDKYTQQSIFNFPNGIIGFAGQRRDGFYADVNAVFDGLQLRPNGKAVDSQAGFNIHMMALSIPMTELGGDNQIAGVYATTSRLSFSLRGKYDDDDDDDNRKNKDFFGFLKKLLYVQVARQGNPLFNEVLVAIKDKDLYSRTSPSVDNQLFSKYALNPEPATLINLLVLGGQKVAPDMNRTDMLGLFVPDMIKVDLSTDPVRLAGNGPNDPNNPDDPGFSRLSIFGGDVLESRVAGHPFRLPSQLLGLPAGKFFVPGGWPNGRRFGEDPVDIAVIALTSDLRDPNNLIINPLGLTDVDGITGSELGFNKVFPYESTPQNGRRILFPQR